MKDWIAYYRKALAGVAGVAVLALATAWFIVSPHHVTDNEWFLIISALVGGGGGPLLSKPNAPKPARNQRGGVSLVGVLVVVLLVLLILFLLGAVR